MMRYFYVDISSMCNLALGKCSAFRIINTVPCVKGLLEGLDVDGKYDVAAG